MGAPSGSGAHRGRCRAGCAEWARCRRPRVQGCRMETERWAQGEFGKSFEREILSQIGREIWRRVE